MRTGTRRLRRHPPGHLVCGAAVVLPAAPRRGSVAWCCVANACNHTFVRVEISERLRSAVFMWDISSAKSHSFQPGILPCYALAVNWLLI
eukprot:scaffold77009_cov53-Phaeocystis_antarctica.AAC.1